MTGLFGNRRKSGKTYPPVSDTARSVAYGQVIEILCSGGNHGIEGVLDTNGFTTGNFLEGIYLDETPLVSAGTSNFQGITVVQRKGAPLQPYLEGFNNQLVSETAVGAEIKLGVPITRSFINENCSAIRIRLSFILTKNRKEGGQVVQVVENSVTFRIYIKEGNGAYVLRSELTVSGKYSEPFERYWYYPVNSSRILDEFYIRIERVTGADDDDNKRVIRWESYSEIVEDVISFKRMAFIGIRFDAEEFGTSFPERRYKLGGTLLDIPTNATVEYTDRGLNYTGNWDGLFKAELTRATSDFFPILWYLLTDETDGLGDIIKPYMINRFSLYDISRYNNEYIEDGRGGYERRYLFNFVLNKQQDAWKAIDAICSGCNVYRYWENGVLNFYQDRPSPIFAIITNADVVEFEYSATDIDERATAVQVTWTNPDNFFKTRPEYFTDPVLVKKYGYKLKQIEAVGATRRSQVIRMARAVVYSENLETEILNFTARGFAAFLPIGKIIAVADLDRKPLRIGGLIGEGSTTTQVNLDLPVAIENVSGFDERFYLYLYPDVAEAVRLGQFDSGYAHYLRSGATEGRWSNGYLVAIMLPNLSIEIRRVANSAGVYTTLFLDSSLTSAPLEFSNWVLFTPEVKPDLFRIVGKSTDEENLDLVTVTCTQYNPDKWALIERNLEIQDRKPTIQTITITPPTNVLLSHLVVFAGSNRTLTLNVSWKVPINADGSSNPYIRRYIVSYQQNDGAWQSETESLVNSISFTNVAPGRYRARVAAVNFADVVSEFEYSNVILVSTAQMVAQHVGLYYSGFIGEL